MTEGKNILEYKIRNAVEEEIDFTTKAELLNDQDEVTQLDIINRRDKISSFIRDPQKIALTALSAESKPIGSLLAQITQVTPEIFKDPHQFSHLSPSLFDGCKDIMAMFALWVHPEHRRKGVATKLKLTLEDIALSRGIDCISTHTEFDHVVEINIQMGFKVVRVGPIWDQVIRTSLLKKL